MTPTEEVQLAVKAAKDEYDEAAAQVAADPTNKLKKLAKRQAAERVDAERLFWREVGAAVGNRPVGTVPGSRDFGRPTIGVLVSNNDGSVA
jgi:hypothetical protein